MLDRDAEVQKEMAVPNDEFAKFHERNVDPNMNGYKIVFMRHRPQKIHEYSEDYVCKRNSLSQYRAYPGFEARMRTLFCDPIKFECCEKMSEPQSAEIILIEKPQQLELLNDLASLEPNEFVGINVQMKPDQFKDDRQEIEVFGPSLLTLCTIDRAYIVDLYKLTNKSKARNLLDDKLSWAFRMLPVIFVSFNMPTMVNYFREFLPSYRFLQYIPRIIDVKFMFYKIKLMGERTFALVHYILFGKKFDLSMVKTDWEKRPLDDAQLKQSAFEAQVLLRMVYKLKWIGENRDKPKQRIFLNHLFHSVGNFQIIENRLTPDWSVGNSCYTKRKIIPKEPHREEFIVQAVRQLQIDGYTKVPPNFMETMTKRFYANKNAYRKEIMAQYEAERIQQDQEKQRQLEERMADSDSIIKMFIEQHLMQKNNQ